MIRKDTGSDKTKSMGFRMTDAMYANFNEIRAAISEEMGFTCNNTQCLEVLICSAISRHRSGERVSISCDMSSFGTKK